MLKTGFFYNQSLKSRWKVVEKSLESRSDVGPVPIRFWTRSLRQLSLERVRKETRNRMFSSVLGARSDHDSWDSCRWKRVKKGGLRTLPPCSEISEWDPFWTVCTPTAVFLSVWKYMKKRWFLNMFLMLITCIDGSGTVTWSQHDLNMISTWSQHDLNMIAEKIIILQDKRKY